MNDDTERKRFERLLNPHADTYGFYMAYQFHLGTVRKGEGPIVTLTGNPALPFRPHHLLVLARMAVVYPWWMRAFAWITLPWIRLDWDDTEPDGPWWQGWTQRAWAWYRFRPIDACRQRYFQRAQQEALASCQLARLHVGNVSALAGGPLPLSLLTDPYEGGFLDLPTCSPQVTITAEFHGTAACDFDVTLTGFAAEVP